MRLTFLVCSEGSGRNLIRMIDGQSPYCGPSPPRAFCILGGAMLPYGDLSRNDIQSRPSTGKTRVPVKEIGVHRFLPHLPGSPLTGARHIRSGQFR